jgi:hypothetical protein
MAVRVLLVGLGPIGVGVGKLLRERKDVAVVAAVDIDPRKAGRDLGQVLGGASMGVAVSSSIQDGLATKPAVAVLATGSRLPAIAPQLFELIDGRCSTVSTSEELAFPRRRHPDLSAEIDRRAKARKVAVVGVGVNPGFAMDLVPILLTAPCPAVEAIRVERVVDASLRREPLQRKVGIGMSPEEFRLGVERGTIGHIGLRESAEMIAAAMGWDLDHFEETTDPVIRDGAVLGLHQTATASVGGKPTITYDLVMAAGAASRDEVWISGPMPLHFHAVGGIHGDVATWSITASAVLAIAQTPAGLHTVYEMPALHWRLAA